MSSALQSFTSLFDDFRIAPSLKHGRGLSGTLIEARRLEAEELMTRLHERSSAAGFDEITGQKMGLFRTLAARLIEARRIDAEEAAARAAAAFGRRT